VESNVGAYLVFKFGKCCGSLIWEKGKGLMVYDGTRIERVAGQGKLVPTAGGWNLPKKTHFPMHTKVGLPQLKLKG